MNSALSWDDMRLVHAILRRGSLTGAARDLGVSHPTVYRRIGRLEHRLGARLFDRSPTGYAPTTAAEEISTLAERLQEEALQVERRIAGRDLSPSGQLRVTTTDALLFGLLSPIFAEFRRRYPMIGLDIAVSDQLFNLSRREADIAIRPSAVAEQTLVGRKIGVIAQAVYRGDARPAGGERDPETDATEWIGPDEAMNYSALENWLTERGDSAVGGYRVNSIYGMLAAAREGIGQAVLPCYLADPEPRLTRVGEPIPELATDLWLLTHADLRNTVRVRVFLDFIAEAVKARAATLRG